MRLQTLALLFFASAAASSRPALSAPPDTLSLGVRSDSVRHVALGFLNGFALSEAGDSAYAAPAPLRIHAARGNASFGLAINREEYYRRFQVFRFLRKRDPRGLIHLVISDGWPHRQWPYSADSAGRAEWERTVHNWITTAVDTFGLERVQVDIFNEPESLFGQSPEQPAVDAFLASRPLGGTAYYNSWKATVRYIRALIPPYNRVRIVGPSLSGYHPFVREFLKTAAADSVLPDVVSWHEIDGGSKLDLDRSVEDARAAMREHAIPERDISISEYMDREETHNPGIAVAFFAKLEGSRVASAMRSCWGEDCKAGNYNGLFAPRGRSFRPRSLWWAYHWYAGLSGALIVPSTPPPAACIGSWDPARKRLDLLYANASTAERLPARRIRVLALPSEMRGRFRLTTDVLNASGTAEAWPRRSASGSIRVADGGFGLEVPALGPGDVLRIRMRPE